LLVCSLFCSCQSAESTAPAKTPPPPHSSVQIENEGRNILNEKEVLLPLLQELGASRGLEVIAFDHSKYPTLASLFALFGRARLLVGPHGGCLTNVNYMCVVRFGRAVFFVGPVPSSDCFSSRVSEPFLRQVVWKFSRRSDAVGGWRETPGRPPRHDDVHAGVCETSAC
jgi:hypothetical protein